MIYKKRNVVVFCLGYHMGYHIKQEIDLHQHPLNSLLTCLPYAGKERVLAFLSNSVTAQAVTCNGWGYAELCTALGFPKNL